MNQEKLHGKWRSVTKISLLFLSPLMIVSCASSSSPTLLQGLQNSLSESGGSALKQKEREELRTLIRSTYPKFPPPTKEAIQAIREKNDPALNAWVQELTVLCRQLEESC